jgi:RNA polymerase sigma factor (sigma-70 family)
MESIKNRNAESWDILVDSFADRLREDIQKSLRKYGLPATMAEDISQESWLTAIRNIDVFVWQDENRFYHWLRVISCNHIHRAYRHIRTEVSIDDYENAEDELTSFFEAYRLQGRNVEDEVVAREQMESLVEALHTLKPVEGEIFIRWLMGETPKILAADYHKLPRTISMLVLRAKQKVEATLEFNRLRRGKDRRSSDDT